MSKPKIATIIHLLERYKAFGIVKGGELCLPKDIAIDFLTDLGKLNIGILGFDGWHYVSQHNHIISQDLRVDVSIDENILLGDDFPTKSLLIAKDYIVNKLPEGVDFISFTLDIPYLWEDLFPG